MALQKQHDAADPGSREALRLRVQVGAREVAELVLGAEARRRKSRDNTYRAILFGQVAMKHNQEEILKLLRSLLVTLPFYVLVIIPLTICSLAVQVKWPAPLFRVE